MCLYASNLLLPERCEACNYTLSSNLISINNVITAAKGEEMTFSAAFTHQDHNGFTLSVNKKISNPDFPCISVRDTNAITQTLIVDYHCVAMKPGNYVIESYVTFCNFLYEAQAFTLIVRNGKASCDIIN